MSAQQAWAWLVESVRVLAASPAEQIASQPRGIPVAEEIALDFDSARRMGWLLKEEGLLSTEAELTVQELDHTLEGMSGEENAPMWHDEALWTDPNWRLVRVIARRALDELLRGS